MAESPKLTRFQKRFAALVASGLKPTQAVRDLKWKGSRPDVKASKLMALPQVREAIAKLDENALVAAGVSRVQIVKRLAQIGFGDIRNLYNESGQLKAIDQLDDDAAAHLAGVEVEELFAGNGEARKHVGFVRKIKRWDPVKALTELAVIAGLKKNDQAPQAPIGPGLTVIVQQGTQVNGQQTVQTHRVEVNLPRPT